MEIIKARYIDIEGGAIPVTLWTTGATIGVSIDGVKWFELNKTEEVRAVVMFEMLADHITDYYHYEAL